MIKGLMIDCFKNTRFIELNAHNCEVLNFICTKVDSSYRNYFNPDNKESARHIITDYSKEGDWLQCREKVYRVCETIDRENSTHLSVSGFYGKIGEEKNPDNARGIQLMVNCITKYDGLFERIKIGESEVVNQLAKAVTSNKKTISKFSFASKFSAGFIPLPTVM